jgi:hypothetical protein
MPSAQMTFLPDPSDVGYRIVEPLLDESEALSLLRTLDSSPLSRSRAGARHLMGHPAVHDVAHDRRLFAIASEFLGPTATPYRATLFDKSRSRNWRVTWHQDTALRCTDNH